MRHVPIAHTWICPSVSLCINDNNKTANIGMHKVHVQSANVRVHNVQVHITRKAAKSRKTSLMLKCTDYKLKCIKRQTNLIRGLVQNSNIGIILSMHCIRKKEHYWRSR